MSTETCPTTIWDASGWNSYPCARPIKRAGLCGIHAAAKERALKGQAARDELRAAGQLIVDRLAAHGVYAFTTSKGAQIGMTAAALADLLDGKATR